MTYHWKAWVAAVAVSGCASMTLPAPGSPAADAVARLGRPDVSCPRDDGGQWWVWSQQPWGTNAWAAGVDGAGRIESVQAALTDAGFNRLADGVWSRERLLCHFGPPAEVSSVGLPSSRQVVWSYRYYREGVWPSLMHVHLGPAGDQVTHFHSGPDTYYEDLRWAF